MKFFRHATGYSLLDKRRSENFREELEIFNLTIKFNKYRKSMTLTYKMNSATMFIKTGMGISS